jgi:FKBP-type peptidyl-prolyl cis-trans isomerase 2
MIFDTSVGRAPLEFVLGDGRILPGIEQVVAGMNPGESRTIHIPADDGFGPRRKENVWAADRHDFPAHLKPEVGQRLQIRHFDHTATVVTVTHVSRSTVTLDANHPLAGRDLRFDIQLLEIG